MIAPTLRIEEVEVAHSDYDRVWLFLDYGEDDEQPMRSRWAIGARGEDGLWLFCPWHLEAPTHEWALGVLAIEVDLAKQAIEQIRNPGSSRAEG